MNPRAILLVLLAATLAACDKPAPAGPDQAHTPNSPAAPPAAAAPAATVDPGDSGASTPASGLPEVLGFSLDAMQGSVTARGPDAPVLVDVRTAEHDGFDRIVFEFDADGLPAWHVGGVAIPIIQCGSGQVTPVSGTAWLQVRFNGAAAHTPEGKPTSGPRQRRLRHPVLRDLARTCDFEGEVTWVAGLAGKHPFRVDALSAPPRLVVDIAH